MQMKSRKNVDNPNEQENRETSLYQHVIKIINKDHNTGLQRINLDKIQNTVTQPGSGTRYEANTINLLIKTAVNILATDTVSDNDTMIRTKFDFNCSLVITSYFVYLRAIV